VIWGFARALPIFLGMLSELLHWNGGIIAVPDGAEYSLQETLNVIAYAATSTNNSPEAAANELRRKNPKASVPSADTVLGYIKGKNSVEKILSFFRALNSRFLPLLQIPGTPQNFAIDFHNECYYGEKNAEGVRGIQPKNGTSWGHVYFTIDWLGSPAHTLDIVNVTGLNKDYAALMRGVLLRLQALELRTGTIFADREFFNLAAISTCSELGVEFIMAAKIDKRITKLLNQHKEGHGREAAIFTYRFWDERSPDFYLVAIPNREYDPRKRAGPDNKEFLLFATSIAFDSPEEFVKRVPQSYRARWKIETGYRVKKEFKIRTCTRSYVARVLFFVVQCLMHNFLNLLKRNLCITAQQLKARIVEDIEGYLKRGGFCRKLSLRAFYKKIAQYNQQRVLELQARVAGP
jgi:hypothetical protein